MSPKFQKGDPEHRMATVGVTSAGLGALFALVATWAIGGTAFATVDPTGAASKATVESQGSLGHVVAGVALDTSNGLTGAMPVCIPATEPASDSDGSGSGSGGSGSGGSGGSGSGSGGSGSGGSGSGGSGGSGSGSGGSGSGGGSTSPLLSLQVGANVGDVLGSGTGGNLLDAGVGAGVGDVLGTGTGGNLLDAGVGASVGDVLGTGTGGGLLGGLLGTTVGSGGSSSGSLITINGSAPIGVSQ